MAKTTGPQQTLEQQRAAYAWQRVSSYQSLSKEYVNLTKSASALIMGNGLLQTLAFFKAKGKGHHEQLLGDLSGWLHKRGWVKSAEFNDVTKSLLDSDGSTYLHATQEALAILRWLRQFADACKGN